MLIDRQELRNLVETVFGHAGSAPREAEILAEHLVEANLMGHDSHGVIRVAPYLEWLAAGQVKANRHARVVSDFGALLGVEGDGGYGLVIAGEAMALAIEKARKEGAAVLALRDCSHLGRIGAWAEMAADAGFVSLHFVNTSGFGIHVAPHGGRDRRLSANPIAAGVPVQGGPRSSWTWRPPASPPARAGSPTTRASNCPWAACWTWRVGRPGIRPISTATRRARYCPSAATRARACR